MLPDPLIVRVPSLSSDHFTPFSSPPVSTVSAAYVFRYISETARGEYTALEKIIANAEAAAITCFIFINSSSRFY